MFEKEVQSIFSPRQVIVEKIHENAIIPTKGSPDAACFDVYSVEEKVIKTGHITIVKTGIRMQIPTGFMIQIVPRSGLAFKHGVDILGGIIDSDYRGEIMVMLTSHDNETYHEIKVGDRIAQMQIIPVPQFEMVQGVLDETVRGEGGFGSTGR